MKGTLFIFTIYFALALCTLKLDRGNVETKKAFDAALLEIWQDGTYDDIYRNWFSVSPERFSDCIENSAKLYYPPAVTNRGLLDEVLDTSTIKMGYFGVLAVLPGFELQNGVVNGGFYPELAEEIMYRIAVFYEIPNITITWVEISTIADFYPDHVAGVYDVIFMGLFKNSMWSAPVAPRDEIWNFSCGIITTPPIRYYVCPRALVDDLVFTSAETLNNNATYVQYIGGGAAQAAALATFPNSNHYTAGNLTTLFFNCESYVTHVIVEVPERITSTEEAFIVDSGPIGTYHNSGAAFRLDL